MVEYEWHGQPPGWQAGPAAHQRRQHRGFGTISGQVVNTSGGTLNVASAGSLTLVDAPVQGGWINIPNTSTLNVLQAWLNSGTINIQGGSLVGSTVTNSGSITGFGTITPLVRNNGGATFTVTGGTLTLSIAPTQIGTFVITHGGTLNVLAAWQNSGTVNLLGGSIVGSTLTNTATLAARWCAKSRQQRRHLRHQRHATRHFVHANNTVDIAANSRLDDARPGRITGQSPLTAALSAAAR